MGSGDRKLLTISGFGQLFGAFKSSDAASKAISLVVRPFAEARAEILHSSSLSSAAERRGRRAACLTLLLELSTFESGEDGGQCVQLALRVFAGNDKAESTGGRSFAVFNKGRINARSQEALF